MRELTIAIEGKRFGGSLGMPAGSHGLVIFAHGSGSSRHSPRNRFVAKTLNERGFATLLMDLLTTEEEAVDSETSALRFDIPLLAHRIDRSTDWCKNQAALGALPIGYFGASTGAGAALLAAAKRTDVTAIVSRGGRPDLAGDALKNVRAPTLLVVGERDPVVIDLNRRAASQMQGVCEIAIVPGAGHLFEQPKALERVSLLAQEWFVRYLPAH